MQLMIFLAKNYCFIILYFWEMEVEGEDAYKPLKTAKTFISTMQSCFQKREGEKMSRELKELYFTNYYSNIPHKSWDVPINQYAFADVEAILGPTFAKILRSIKQFAADRSAGRWSEAFQKHMKVLTDVVKILQEMKEYTQWLAKPLRTIVRATKRIFLSSQKQVNNSSAAAKLKNTLLNTLQRYKSARAIGDEIKREFLPLIDIMQISILLSFHNYEQIQRIIYAPKIYGDFGPRYLNNFLFQKGKYALINQNLKEAEECLSKINLLTQSQKRLVLRYLIPCKMLLGKVFKPMNERERQDYNEYLSVANTMLECDFKKYDELNHKYQKVWLKRGIYLLMDRMRIILWRNLLKRLEAIVGNKIDFQIIQKAVKHKGGAQDMNQCICIVGNLIYEGYLKGYIFQNPTKKVLVLKPKDAFPSLNSISR